MRSSSNCRSASWRTPYYSRPAGSGVETLDLAGRLSHSLDGAEAVPAERPLSLFGAFGIALIIMSIGLAIPIIITYVQRDWYRGCRPPVLSTGLMVLAFLSIACGLILDTVTRGRREAKLIAYLALRAPGEERRRS